MDARRFDKMPRFRSTDGLWLNYEVTGAEDTDVLVLLHANPFDNRMWLYQIAHLSQYFRVVALDLPGYGKSSPLGKKAISIADMAKDVWCLLSELRTDIALIAGLSVGSSIAMQFALDFQPHVKALIVAGGGAGPIPRMRMEERIKGYRQRGISYRRRHIESLVTGEFASSDLGQYLISMFLETNRTTDVESIVRIFEALGEHDITSRLHEINVPTLIINGEEDRTLPRARDLNKAIGGSKHAIIGGAGHACALEKPWEFHALVLNFLRESDNKSNQRIIEGERLCQGIMIHPTVVEQIIMLYESPVALARFGYATELHFVTYPAS